MATVLVLSSTFRWPAPMAGAQARAADPGEKIITLSSLVLPPEPIGVRIAGNDAGNRSVHITQCKPGERHAQGRPQQSSGASRERS